MNQASTTTTIKSDNPDPSDVGQAITVAYDVVVDGPGAGTPTGSVTVSDGVDSCTGTVAAGQCALTLTSAGARSLTATYAGDGNFATSTSAAEAHSVTGGPTTTAITLDDPDPSVVGQPVTVHYSVTSAGGGSPTGRRHGQRRHDLVHGRGRDRPMLVDVHEPRCQEPDGDLYR